MIEPVQEQIIDKKRNEIKETLAGFLREFKLTETPIEVSFRALLPQLNNIERYGHLIHSYPAKLLVHIPHFFLNNDLFSKKGDTVLDPFCGTGTVMLEAMLAGRNALGADANPLARLIAKVKTNSYLATELSTQLNQILPIQNPTVEGVSMPDVVNLNYWFNELNRISLNHIINQIELIANEQVKDFFRVCFSNVVKKVSNADPAVSVPVKLNKNRFAENSPAYKKAEKRMVDIQQMNVFEKFQAICKENINRLSIQSAFFAEQSMVNGTVISNDARNLTIEIDSQQKLGDESVQLIITSPPYAGAQKYIRSSSLNLGWLGLAKSGELKELDALNIGRENYKKTECTIPKTSIESCDQLVEIVKSINPVRAQIVSNYILEMQRALTESMRVLKKDGYLIIIVGNNKVCNLEFNTQEYLTTFLEGLGLKLILKLIDDIKSYGLMTKRNKTADIISREWVLVFKKDA